jgi:hypothetical protein
VVHPDLDFIRAADYCSRLGQPSSTSRFHLSYWISLVGLNQLQLVLISLGRQRGPLQEPRISLLYVNTFFVLCRGRLTARAFAVPKLYYKRHSTSRYLHITKMKSRTGGLPKVPAKKPKLPAKQLAILGECQKKIPLYSDSWCSVPLPQLRVLDRCNGSPQIYRLPCLVYCLVSNAVRGLNFTFKEAESFTARPLSI